MVLWVLVLFVKQPVAFAFPLFSTKEESSTRARTAKERVWVPAGNGKMGIRVVAGPKEGFSTNKIHKGRKSQESLTWCGSQSRTLLEVDYVSRSFFGATASPKCVGGCDWKLLAKRNAKGQPSMRSHLAQRLTASVNPSV